MIEDSPDSDPNWELCGTGATHSTPHGCIGVRVGNWGACLAHLSPSQRREYFDGLGHGSNIDHRGTTFTAELMNELLDALQNDTTGDIHARSADFKFAIFIEEIDFKAAHFNCAYFDETTFAGTAIFNDSKFQQHASFEGATFRGDALFDSVTFYGHGAFNDVAFEGEAIFRFADFNQNAAFYRATFSRKTSFSCAKFQGDATFVNAAFNGTADFIETEIHGEANFTQSRFDLAKFQRAKLGASSFKRVTFTRGATFTEVRFQSTATFLESHFKRIAIFTETSFNGTAEFGRAVFDGDADFRRAQFSTTSRLGPISCKGTTDLSFAGFERPTTLQIEASRVKCIRTRWASTATLQLRGASLDLSDAVFEYPVLVTARPAPFTVRNDSHSPREPLLPHERLGVRLVSLTGVDAAHLVLNDVDLSDCQFGGAVHLDQLKVDGRCSFASNPSRWSRRFPWKQSRRNTLIEEHHWRVGATRNSEQAIALGWRRPPASTPSLKPAAVAALYRQLRKSLEDGKNEPDAADFYYGECEMRRHDPTRPWGERMLLRFYWALSGYGLRATRALAWLGVSMTATVAVMMLWGLPVDDPKPATTGRQVAVGQEISLVTDTPKPVNPTNALVNRISTDRFEKSLRTVINSVVFRSSGQNLTTAGTYAEMISRLSEPVLLGLAVLAIRSRVKR
ncbi:pentapeptide repeat-containing protein [Streptomyces sp. NPDC091278]|uniref:pentapeptide repeat-containing protein n=1 Tax=Streptomyces sp. NPDC091278 TaxID=3155301 RepID=UPI00344C5C3F